VALYDWLNYNAGRPLQHVKVSEKVFENTSRFSNQMDHSATSSGGGWNHRQGGLLPPLLPPAPLSSSSLPSFLFFSLLLSSNFHGVHGGRGAWAPLAPTLNPPLTGFVVWMLSWTKLEQVVVCTDRERGEEKMGTDREWCLAMWSGNKRGRRRRAFLHFMLLHFGVLSTPSPASCRKMAS